MDGKELVLEMSVLILPGSPGAGQRQGGSENEHSSSGFEARQWLCLGSL